MVYLNPIPFVEHLLTLAQLLSHPCCGATAAEQRSSGYHRGCQQCQCHCLRFGVQSFSSELCHARTLNSVFYSRGTPTASAITSWDVAVVDAPASVVKMVGRSVQLDAFLSVPYTYIYIYIYTSIYTFTFYSRCLRTPNSMQCTEGNQTHTVRHHLP